MTGSEYQLVPTDGDVEDGSGTPNTAPSTEKNENTEQDEAKGYGLMLLSVLFGSIWRISTHSVMVYDGMSVSKLMLLWGIVQVSLATLSVVFIYGLQAVLPRTINVFAILGLRALLGASSLYLLQHAYSLMPVGGATAIFYVNPTFTLVLGFFVLGEPASRRELMGAALSLFGVLIIASPWKAHLHDSATNVTAGVAAAAAAAALAACAYTALRAAAKQGAHHMAAVLAYGAAIIGVGVIRNASSGAGTTQVTNTSASARTLMVAVGGAAAGFASNAALSLGFAYCRAGTGALVRKADVGLVFVLAALILGEIPKVAEVAGAVLIVGGTAIVALAPATRNTGEKKTWRQTQSNTTMRVQEG